MGWLRPAAVGLAVAWWMSAGCSYVVADGESAPPAPPVDASAAGDSAVGPGPIDSGGGLDGSADTGAEADGPPPTKRVFVTAVAYPGDFGGVAQADANCNAEAAAAGLVGSFAAWLSTDDADANGRFQPGVYYSTAASGARVIALPAFGQNLDSSVGFTAKGDAVDTFAWTGTLASGIRSGQSCTSWTNRGTNGTTGRTGRTNGAWTNSGFAPCSETKRLYCFER